jgi:hypothetical protein
MKSEDSQFGTMLHALQERAKELNCLYQVGELLNQQDRPLEEVFAKIIEVLPPGWQYPEDCQACISFEGHVIASSNYQATPWLQKADIVVSGEILGSVEVSYRQEMPKSDEGPFLKEERRLINTIAERVAGAVTQRRLRATFEAWTAAGASPATQGGWRIVLEFLRDTDSALLYRISRKLINHLNWSGVAEAKELLQQRVGASSQDHEGLNCPLPPETRGSTADITTEAFQIAAEHMSETEILNSVTRWIKEDKSSFLVRALEDQDTPLGEVMEAMERYRHIGIEESELSLYTQKGLRVSLIRRFFSESLDFINVAKNFIDIKDFYDLLGRVIYPAGCHGKLGGKSAGLFLAKKIIDKSPEASAQLREVKIPKTWYLTSDWIQNFVHHNDLEDVLNRKYMELEQVRQEYPHLVSLFKRSSFPSEFAKGLALALEDLGDVPLIVRSSSLLEDRAGSAFSGKYKSLFLGNRGTKEERLAALMDAIAEVYASVFGPDPTEYRAERGLLDVHEEMGIMIQEVVGRPVGTYFMPSCSGVAFSNNEFRWSARIRREDGLIRIVPGLGTRAVDRVADDYPVLIAPGQPNLRVNATPDEVLRYSPKHIDLINLSTNTFETVESSQVLRYDGQRYPRIRDLVSIVNNDRIEQVIGPLPDFRSQDAVFTFEGLIRKTQFVAIIRELLSLLQSKFGAPVDVEFAYDGLNLFLLQCRPQSFGADAVPSSIPQNLPTGKVIFSANHFVSNGKVPEITHIVYVDADGYSQLPDQSSMREVGRAVGRLNKLLPKRQFILIGPGRWGSRGDIKLGVPVTYSDINNSAVLIEVARQHGNYLPELSFGTHFFQDLVEASIRYLPLYPDDSSTAFNKIFLRSSRNVLRELLPEFAYLEDTLRVIDVPLESDGLILRVLMNADLDQAVGFLSPRVQQLGGVEPGAEVVERGSEEHWRWRFRIAQKIAQELDPKRFGVKAIYLIGSAKNATSGPASDIDLLVHFEGTEQQEADLLLWFEGWSRCLSETNFLRTGYRTDGLLDVHVVTDKDIAERSSFAVKIDAVTDPARKLPMNNSHAG